MAKAKTGSEIIVAIGQSAFGTEGWQSPLARALDVDQSTINKVVGGSRPLTASLRAKLASFCVLHSIELTKRAQFLRDAISELADEIRDKKT
jgi:hypothetical protein